MEEKSLLVSNVRLSNYDNNCNISKALTGIKKFKKIRYDSNSKCKDCIKKSICRYCPCRFYLETGSFKQKSNWYCDMATKIIKTFKKSISDQEFQEMFNILIENMKAYNKQLIIKENDFLNWKNNILTNEKLNTYMEKDKDKIIGYIQYIKEGNSYCICEIQIRKENQKDKKTFKKLIGHFVDVFDIQDDSIVYCNINPNNLNSISVFEGIGFKIVIKNRYEISGNKFLKWYNESNKRK